MYYLDKKEREEYLENIPQEKYTPKTIIDGETLKKELQFIDINGYSREFEESGIGITSLAVPILSKNNNLKGTISITASTSVVEELLESSINDMKEYSKKIMQELEL